MYLYRDLDITQEHVYIKKQSHRSKVRVAVVSYRGKYECMHVENYVSLDQVVMLQFGG